jgi:hypothetical protein
MAKKGSAKVQIPVTGQAYSLSIAIATITLLFGAV